MSRLKIYLVEDSPVITENLIATLEDLADAQVVGCSATVDEAITDLTRADNDWQLAIVDIFLPKGSGFDVLAACRYREPGRHMVVLSNYASPAVRKRSRELGADAVFDKSTELEALVAYCHAANVRA
ncbi:MAG: response regulator [Spongiibacteraceae bacterium]